MVMLADARNFPNLFFQDAAKRRGHIALRYKDYGIWNRISWQEYGEKVREVAAGLIALDLVPDEKVSIFGNNKPEWLFSQVGTMASRGVTCGIYPTSSSDEVKYIINHSESRVVFVQGEEEVDKILEILPEIEVTKIVVWDDKGLWGFSHPRFMFFEEFLKKGKAFMEKNPDIVDQRVAAIKPEDTAMIIYTSGTTGRPKGAMISHSNILHLAESLIEANPLYETDSVLSYLPLAHVAENIFSLLMAVPAGITVNFVESMDTLPGDLREVSPTFFFSVPRIWEKFASNIRIKMSDSTHLKQFLYWLAMLVGLRYVRAERQVGRRFFWGILYWPFYWGVLYFLKRQLGFERVRLGLCGAAPASKELFEYYKAMGIPLMEGYGQTESTGIIAVHRLNRPRLGYVGEPLSIAEVKIAEDGEILLRGEGVFKGYFKDPELTAITLEGGWLHTGDIGAMDSGFLRILDRKKDIIITAGGKNVTPAFIENKLKFSIYIQDAVVIGDKRRYLVALVLIDEENVTQYAQDNQIPFTTFEDLTQNREIIKLIDKEVQEVNKTLARVETIKKFKLLPRRFYVEDGDVTPTSKVKRSTLEKTYHDLIDSMYN
jgi:long-chain acyl-CoA synthetase